MEAKNIQRHIRLGTLVIAGTALVIAALYLIGDKRNLFGDSFRIRASFRNVNGLLPGNGVRFAGIDVGTVSDISIDSDSAIIVTMIIEDRVRPYIRRNAVAIIGTDGLMGNKLINILPVPGNSVTVSDMDLLQTLEPVGTDEMTRTLAITNQNIRVITDNLRLITDRLGNNNALWQLLGDSLLADDLREAIVQVRITGNNTAILTGDLRRITRNVLDGKGTVGALVTDTALADSLRQSIVRINYLTNEIALVSGDLSAVTTRIRQGEGALGALIMDTTLVPNLNAAVQSAQAGAEGFRQNMDALRQSIFLRRYFKKQQPSSKTK
jgi:phospholipid/cholesterol/gamma-HCH transport system substrate-binding protein